MSRRVGFKTKGLLVANFCMAAAIKEANTKMQVEKGGKKIKDR